MSRYYAGVVLGGPDMKPAPLGRSAATACAALLAALLTACGSEKGPNAASAGSSTGSAGGGAGQAGGAAAAGTMAGGNGSGGGGSHQGGSAGVGGSSGSGGGSTGCRASAMDAEQPMLLSETKCVDMADPSKPAPGLVPYSVRSALWSDGASKERFLRVPDGAKIHVIDCAIDVEACGDPGAGGGGLDDGHFDLPVGTVLVKNFSIEGKRIETRLLIRRASRVWKGFSYEWDDAGTEATLLPDTPDAKAKPVGDGSQIWHYPTRGQCLDCHTQYGGRSLGPSTRQLDSEFGYADGTLNQLDKLGQLGLFDAPPKDLPAYPDPFGDDSPETLEQRARSYIHTNCAICHRPGGEFSTVDMRFPTAFESTNLCDQSEHDTELVPKYRIVPGDPSLSAMSFRMHVLDDPPEVRMPKLGSTVVDEQGAKLIDDWISSLPTDACPPQQ